MHEKYYSVGAAAKALGISRGAVRARITSGVLPATEIIGAGESGRQFVVSGSALELSQMRLAGNPNAKTDAGEFVAA